VGQEQFHRLLRRVPFEEAPQSRVFRVHRKHPRPAPFFSLTHQSPGCYHALFICQSNVYARFKRGERGEEADGSAYAVERNIGAGSLYFVTEFLPAIPSKDAPGFGDAKSAAYLIEFGFPGMCR
jgi:hypothetical protein